MNKLRVNNIINPDTSGPRRTSGAALLCRGAQHRVLRSEGTEGTKSTKGLSCGGAQHWVLRLGLAVGLLSLFCPSLLADVTVTEPTGGNGISADTSFNSTNGAAFTALGDIVITEGLTTDFAKGTNKTFILTLPGGWRFNTTAGASVSLLNSRDITAASV